MKGETWPGTALVVVVVYHAEPIMESFHYDHLPPALSTVYVALFTNVANASQLRARLVKAASMDGAEGDIEREAVNFAFIDARLVRSIHTSPRRINLSLPEITSRLHLLTAVYHAILAQVQGALRTKTVHSEILWALNPSNNVRLLASRLPSRSSHRSRLPRQLGDTACQTALKHSLSFASPTPGLTSRRECRLPSMARSLRSTSLPQSLTGLASRRCASLTTFLLSFAGILRVSAVQQA